MNPDDRMDEALRAIAHAEASRDFAPQVRTRLQARDGAPTAWPRVATALAAVLLVATFAWVMREAPPPASEQVARTTAPDSASRPQPVAPGAPRREDVSTPAARAWRVAAAPVRPGTATASKGDHDRALEPLPPIDALSVTSIVPGDMVVIDQIIPPLAPIAPLSDVHDVIGDVDRGEL